MYMIKYLHLNYLTHARMFVKKKNRQSSIIILLSNKTKNTNTIKLHRIVIVLYFQNIYCI